MFGYVPRIKWHPKPVSRRKGYGSEVANSLMSGGKYIWGERGISLIAEAMEELQVYSFLQSSNAEILSELFDKIDKLVIMMGDRSKTR